MISETKLKALSKEAADQLILIEGGLINLNQLKALLVQIKTLHEGGAKSNENDNIDRALITQTIIQRRDRILKKIKS